MESRPLPNGGDPVVVALAASAGGLEAFSAVLSQLPADTGAAFVILQHLDPAHASHLPELLRQATAMPVAEIHDGMALVANRVHVIPAGAHLTLRDGAFALTPRGSVRVPRPFDVFLQSMAECHADRAVAVVLSGNGTDGAQGVQAVREQGGITLAQEPTDAAVDAMPLAAIATGCVDVVLPARLIGTEIARITTAAGATLLARDADADEGPADAMPLGELLPMLQRSTGVDFAQYRQTTVRRRIRRRMRITGVQGWPEYVAHLRANPSERQTLARDILIHVTRFFRDPNVFLVLARRVFPDLIRRQAAGGAVRIWVPGCSTGEEAYSLAIAFVEAAEGAGSKATCQIFATDINESLLETARRGAYGQHVMVDVPPDSLERHFVQSGGKWQVGARVRDMCVFSRHDLLRDPPLSRMDLVSCRNVLLYLERQRDVLELLHFSLDEGGYLVLGRSEGTHANPDRFVTFDRDAHIFRSSPALARHIPTLPSDPRDARSRPVPPLQDGQDASTAFEELVAANEELQSLNEELESSKEETEAANQELRTLNEELDRRNIDLNIARDFAQATLDTVRGSLVVLDHENPRALRQPRLLQVRFGLGDGTVEQVSLYDLGRGCFDVPPLRALLTQTLVEQRDLEDVEVVCDVPAQGLRTLLINVRHFEPEHRLLLAIEDVTRLRELESEQRHSEKMEAIVHLAAGVAHDFNNLMASTMLQASLLLELLPPATPEREHAEGILAASRQAADLTRQLLAYAGKGRWFQERVDLSAVVEQTLRVLHPTLPARVQVRLDLARGLPLLLADPSQVHQVAANLVLNAVEAIGDASGHVTVRTCQRRVAGSTVAGTDGSVPLPEGDYVVIEVADTGIGMTADVQRRMFDPFFSTKFLGRGLGLAALSGIVRSYHGGIQVHSVPGRGGTRVRVLPCERPERPHAPHRERLRRRAVDPGPADRARPARATGDHGRARAAWPPCARRLGQQ